MADSSSSSMPSWLGWVLGGLGVLAAGTYFATRPDEGGGEDEPEASSKGAGWYVLCFDHIEETNSKRAYDRLPDGRPARLKEFAGAFESKEEANEVALQKREDGWRGKTSRAIVDYRGRAPWKVG